MISRAWFKAVAGGAVLLFFSVVLWIAYTGRGATMYAFLDNVPGGDKMGHVVLMACLGFVLSWMLSFRAIHVGKLPFHYGALAAFALDARCDEAAEGRGRREM